MNDNRRNASAKSHKIYDKNLIPIRINKSPLNAPAVFDYGAASAAHELLLANTLLLRLGIFLVI